MANASISGRVAVFGAGPVGLSAAAHLLARGLDPVVLGGGHSAINAVLDILRLKEENAATKLVWGLRRNKIEKLLGGGINDKLPVRGALGIATKKAIDEGAMELLAPMSVQRISKPGSRLSVDLDAGGASRTIEVDRIVVAAGFRPGLEMLRKVRLDLDDVVEAPVTLAPMIDPNLHSCGTVRPHGVDELSHTDSHFYIAGMKSYGRAPTYLMKTGYEQVRSIADELVGNPEAARRIELELPETGVCNSRPQSGAAGGGCCAPASEPAPTASSCCGAAPAATEPAASAPAAASGGCCGAPAAPKAVASSCCG